MAQPTHQTHHTTIRANRKGDLVHGRLGIQVTINSEPTCFEFTIEDLKLANDLVQKNRQLFDEDIENTYVELFFAEDGPTGETVFIWRNQLNTTDHKTFNDWCNSAGLQ